LKVVPQPPPSPVEAPSLALPFGPSIEETPNATEPDSAEFEVEEPAVADEAEEPASTDEADAPVADAEVEPEKQPATERAPEPRASMRDMLFGEEAAAAAQAEPTAPSQSEPEPASADWSWRPTRWEPAEESAWTPGATEPAAEEPVAEEAPAIEDASEAAPVAEAKEPEPFAPWKSSFASDSSSDSEPAQAEADDAPVVGYPETPAADSGDGSSAGTVVIIEDDETAANYYATLFRGNGYRVEVANDGVSGVDLCTRVQPQVILLDVMMPRQNGILVLQTLRASDETKNTPVVVMSNFSEPTLIKRAIQLGALEYVIKTQVEGSALLNAMPRWINREKAFAAA
jgi:CheY-like chemotaxis protein